jgi:hypothetical protein
VVAFRNAVKQAMDAAESDFCAEIEDGLKALSAMKEQAND